ncbi:hypothetical protein WN51_05257 [Melipona quadrifasciata]|uniref:Uncharacterized protein n=1 Tax=Melipona quadrifasciata TaxID=166423 RepID=A0A0M8ZTA0_9HYME|nr:hypothetical protein WN51_05257 [Melipona quadrifasciata]
MDTALANIDRSSVHLTRLSLSGLRNEVVSLIDLIFHVDNTPKNAHAKHIHFENYPRYVSSSLWQLTRK